ncbi:Flp pilus assembly protein CpaB [Paludibaculum fermentans]|uniref:Flp pilus assembly protein CpaB n=1 Tax=Paludibaculum fermentans TaxID=1473598 RepID=A0A7S7SM21_PALFE|nr:Flp pilus assembly protein CpaB [Paludibaculum fermentans]QOY89979.1 Flp pilus assembly protein CpaB [Paludibaculum fermentans]
MDRRFLTVLGVSLVFALVVSSIFYQMTSRANGPKKQEVSDLRDMVIAARPLPVGLTVKTADVKVIKVPVQAFPKGAFSKPEDVLDRPVVSSILAEEPISEGRLAQRGSGVGLAPIIPVGMRAVTVRVNDVVGVAGYVLPGMRVDVLITGHPPGNGTTVTKTVLQNILVLSSGQMMQTDQSGKPVDAPNVTVLVTPQQAELLTLAGNEGRIQLVLRNGGDQNIEKTEGLSLSTLYGSHSRMTGGGNGQNSDDPDGLVARRPRPRPQPVAVAATPVAAPPPAPVPDQIITIRGIDKRVENVASKKSNDDAGRNQ